MHNEEQFKDQLRTAGERITSPRVAVFRILMRQAPASMAKIIDSARDDGVDTVTVYRTMDLFRKLGVVVELGLGRNRLFELSDTYQSHHHHFTCTNCGKLIDFDSREIEAALAAVAKASEFTITSHQLEARGMCSSCLAKP